MKQGLLKSIFDYSNGELYWKIRPSPKRNVGDCAGTISGSYKKIQVFGKTYQAHRLIFLMIHGYLPKIIDHIDNNKWNNKIENLREATNSQNMCNVKIPSSNTSGVKGVCWNKNKNAWQVQLRLHGKLNYLGLYKDKELAELVIFEARNKFHGEFARTV